MKYYVGVTDNKWFSFLSNLKPDEVNFWRPGGGNFRAIQTGAPFLFKLHSPYNYIVGGGFFVRYSRLPISLAWHAFGIKNGSQDFYEFANQIRRYRRNLQSPDPEIGCIILTEPFFFAQSDWIPVPPDWNMNIVQGKTYNTQDSFGAHLWTRVQSMILNRGKQDNEDYLPTIREEQERYTAEFLTHARLGQGTFRVLVTEAYNRRCAITGERTLPVLEAIHIKPYAKSGPHRVENGILLRADLHRLFDSGYITITSEYDIEVSKRIKEEYENGREYYAYHRKSLHNLPSMEAERPSPEFIEWHNQNVFVP